MFDTPEEKAALKEVVDAAVEKASSANLEALDKLQTNNKTLLSQLREAKKGAEIDPAKYTALEDKVGELEAALSAKDSTIKKMEKDTGVTVAQLNKQLESESAFTQSYLVESGLTDSLIKAGVEPKFLPAVKAMLKAQVKVVADGDVRKALVGDKPLGDYVAGWAQTDEGKTFVKAPTNGGGGAQGGGGQGGNVKTIAASDKAAFGLNLVELAKGNNSAVKVE